jgi:hypothetical protein
MVTFIVGDIYDSEARFRRFPTPPLMPLTPTAPTDNDLFGVQHRVICAEEILRD